MFRLAMVSSYGDKKGLRSEHMKGVRSSTASALSIAVSTLVLVGHAHPDPVEVGKIIAIQDGDTLTLLDAEQQQHRIRISGIDAPEKGQPFGHVAQVHLYGLAFGRLAIADCPKVDQYGRKVCRVWVDAVDIGLMQVKAGLAWHFKRFAQEQTEDERVVYAHAEDTARAAPIGLWQDEHPVAPWDWRLQLRTRPAPLTFPLD